MRLSRRSLLAGGLTTVAAAAGGAFEWRRLYRPSAADIATLIRRRLGDRPLDHEGVDRFAEEYVARKGADEMAAHQLATFGGVLGIDATRRLAPSTRQQAILDLERRLISRYLRSTDYFRTTPGATVRYVAFADPYETADTNPFAGFDL